MRKFLAVREILKKSCPEGGCTPPPPPPPPPSLTTGERLTVKVYINSFDALPRIYVTADFLWRPCDVYIRHEAILENLLRKLKLVLTATK